MLPQSLIIRQWLAAGVETRDWAALDARWQTMLRRYNPVFDDQLNALLARLADEPGDPLRVLDLGAGPGVLGRRLLQSDKRFHVIHLDADPFLLAACRHLAAPFGDRSQTLEADLREAHWTADILATDHGEINAVVSVTTLHRFSRDHCRTLLRQIREILMPGGIFLNADRLHVKKFAPEPPDPATLTGETWSEFWQNTGREWNITEELAEIEEILGPWEGSEDGYDGDFWLETLTDAGFTDNEVIWYNQGRAVFGGRKPQ